MTGFGRASRQEDPHLGDTVTVRCEVVEIAEKGRAKLLTTVVGADDDKPRLTGEARVLLPRAA